MEEIIIDFSIVLLSAVIGFSIGLNYRRDNAKLKVKLKKIKEYANKLEVFTYIKKDLLNIIEGAEDE